MKNLLTTDEVARQLGVSPTTLRMWRYQGVGPRYIKLEKIVRYAAEDLEAYMEKRTYRSTSEYTDDDEL